MSAVQFKRGRPAKYTSKEEKAAAKRARYHQKSNLKHSQHHEPNIQSAQAGPSYQSSPSETLSYTVNPVASISEQLVNQSPTVDHEPDSGFFYIGDDLDDLLPPISPSLGSVSMDISDSSRAGTPSPEDTHTDEPPLSEPEPSPSTALVLTQALSIRLANQLLQFHGCCQDCHNQINTEHQDQEEEHTGLQGYLDQVENDNTFNVPDVLSCNNLKGPPNPIPAAKKQQLYCGVHTIEDSEPPPYICLEKEDRSTNNSRIAFDIDSIHGYPSSLAVAKQGIL